MQHDLTEPLLVVLYLCSKCAPLQTLYLSLVIRQTSSWQKQIVLHIVESSGWTYTLIKNLFMLLTIHLDISSVRYKRILFSNDIIMPCPTWLHEIARLNSLLYYVVPDTTQHCKTAVLTTELCDCGSLQSCTWISVTWLLLFIPLSVTFSLIIHGPTLQQMWQDNPLLTLTLTIPNSYPNSYPLWCFFFSFYF